MVFIKVVRDFLSMIFKTMKNIGKTRKSYSSDNALKTVKNDAYKKVQPIIKKLRRLGLVIDDETVENPQGVPWRYQSRLRAEYEQDNPRYVAWVNPGICMIYSNRLEGEIIRIFKPRKGLNDAFYDVVAYLEFYADEYGKIEFKWILKSRHSHHKVIPDIAAFIQSGPVPDWPFLAERDNGDPLPKIQSTDPKCLAEEEPSHSFYNPDPLPCMAEVYRRIKAKGIECLKDWEPLSPEALAGALKYLKGYSCVLKYSGKPHDPDGEGIHSIWGQEMRVTTPDGKEYELYFEKFWGHKNPCLVWMINSIPEAI